MYALPTLYKARNLPLKRPVCAICVDRTRGRTEEVRLGYRVTVWLCPGHAAQAFQTKRGGRDFVRTLMGVWQADGCLTVARHRALDAHLGSFAQTAPATGREATPGRSCVAAWKRAMPPEWRPLTRPASATIRVPAAPPTRPAAARCRAGTPNAVGSASALARPAGGYTLAPDGRADETRYRRPVGPGDAAVRLPDRRPHHRPDRRPARRAIRCAPTPSCAWPSWTSSGTAPPRARRPRH